MGGLIDHSEVERLQLFDSNCRIGSSDTTVSSSPVSVPHLIEEMDRVGIAEALVYHANAAGYSPTFGNQQLAEDLGVTPRLHGCWVILPHHTAEMEVPRVLVSQILAAGVRAVRMFPRIHRFSLSNWSVEELLGELSEHKIPLFLDFNRSHWAEEVVDYDQVVRICQAFPTLPVILVREGIGSTRCVYPILDRFDNFYLEISYYQASGGLADISKRFGARHLLFGTGLPEYSAGPAISMIYYLELSFDEKKKISGNNLRHLLLAVR